MKLSTYSIFAIRAKLKNQSKMLKDINLSSQLILIPQKLGIIITLFMSIYFHKVYIMYSIAKSWLHNRQKLHQVQSFGWWGQY